MNLGMYMRGSYDRPEEFQVQPDTGMNPVLQGMMYGQQQDERAQQLQAQQFNLGQAQQQADNQQQVNALASQAYTTTDPTQRNILLAHMAQLDPREAAAQRQQFAQMDAETRQQAAQAMQQAAGMATAVSQMPAGPQKQQAWASILGRMHAAGKDTSLYASVGPDVGAKMMLAQIASSKELLDMAGAQQKKYTLAEVPYGTGKAAVVFDPSTGTYKPLAGAQGAPSGLPAETQAYVPKVMAALGGAQPFDANGQPTPQLLDAVQRVESGGNPNALSPKGAEGAYQLMPATAASVGVTNPNDPAQARAGAAKYLAQLYQQFGGDANKAIAAYNAGPGRVQQALGGAQPVLGIGTGSGKAVTTMTPDQVAAAGLPKGTVAQIDADGAIKVVSKAGGADGPAQTFGDTTKTGDAYLQSLDPAMQRQVLALDQGRMQFPSSFALKTPYWQGLLQAVGQYDPSFDAVNYNSRNQTRKNFTAGKEATQVNALNTVAQHLAQLQADANALDNRSLTPYNYVVNAAESKMGAPQLTNFERDRLPVVQELERVWRGTGGSEGDIQEWTKNLSSSSSPQQFNDAFAHIANLIHGKLAALRDQYVQGMGNTHDAFQFLTPSTRAIFQSLGGEPVGNETTAPGEGPHTGAGGASHIPAPAIQYLKAHPETAAQFDAQFGPGSAQAAMQ